MLKFDWETIKHRRILRVLGEGRMVMNDGNTQFDGLVFELDHGWLSVSVLIDTDELEISSSTLAPDLSTFSDAGDAIAAVGRKLGWSWCAKNSQGYEDMLLLSLFGEDPTDALTPHFAFIGVGSSIEIYTLKPVKL